MGINWGASFSPIMHIVEALYSPHAATGPSRRASNPLPTLSSLLTRQIRTDRRTILEWPKEGDRESGIGLLSRSLSTFKLQSQVLQVDTDWQGDTNPLKTSEGALKHGHANSSICHF